MIIPVSKQLLEIFFISIRAKGYFNAVIVTFVCEIPTCLQNGFSSGPCGMPAASWTPMCMGSWVGIATSDDVNRKLVSSHPSLSSMLHGERMATAPTRFTKTLSVIYIQYQFNGAAAPGNLGPSIYYSAF